MKKTIPIKSVPSLSVHLADALLRRRDSKMEQVSEKSRKVKASTPEVSSVVALPKEALPLSDLLNKARVFSRPARDNQHLHVSDLIGKCLRKIALVDRLGFAARPQALRLNDLLTFGQGDIIHDILRQRATAGGPQNVWGKWACKCGTTFTTEPQLFSDLDPQSRCKACNGALNVYQEVTMLDEELDIVGNPDLLLYLPEFDALHVTELKSMAHDTWKELVRPVPDHVIQVLFYWFLMRKQGYRLTDKVSILYATKGWLFSGDSFKEFVVDAPSQVHRLDIYLAAAKSVQNSRAGGELPARICVSANATEAKKCELCQACFGVTDHENHTVITISQALGTRAKGPRILTRARPNPARARD